MYLDFLNKDVYSMMDSLVCQICYEQGATRLACGHIAHTECLTMADTRCVVEGCKGKPNRWDGFPKVMLLNLMAKLVEFNYRDLEMELRYVQSEIRQISESVSATNQEFRGVQAMRSCVNLQQIIYGKQIGPDQESIDKSDTLVDMTSRIQKKVEMAIDGERPIAIAFENRLPLSVVRCYLFPKAVINAWNNVLCFNYSNNELTPTVPYMRWKTSIVKEKSHGSVEYHWDFKVINLLEDSKVEPWTKFMTIRLRQYSLRVRLPRQNGRTFGEAYLLITKHGDRVAVLYGYVAQETDTAYPKIIEYLEDYLYLSGCVVGYFPIDIGSVEP